MPWHTCAFSGNITNVANTQVPSLVDQIIRQDGNFFMLPQDMFLCYAYLQAAHIARGFLNSPKLQQTNPLYIRPTNIGATPVSNPNIDTFSPNFIKLRGQEDLGLFVTGTNVGAEVCTGVIAVSPQIDPLPAGEAYMLYATSTTAAVANSWTPVVYNLANALPQGQYVMIGSQMSSANGIAHRWTFSNQIWRPGFISNALETDKPSILQITEELGPMGTFYSYDLPRLEVLAGGADALHQIFIEVVKIG